MRVVGQALATAGGAAAILAIDDYTATGRVTYHENQDVQGTITLTGLGLGSIREDSNVSTGARSFSINNGQAAFKREDGVTRQLNYRYQLPLVTSSMVIPCWQLASALSDPLFGLSYKGTSQVDGYTVYNIRVQLMPPGPPDPNGVIAEYLGADFFIDTTTYQVRMIQDAVIHHFPRKIRYSDYKSTNGVLVPFSINEEINGRPGRTIQFDQFNFNTGLQDSAFAL